MVKEVTFTFRPKKENLHHWNEFVKLCKQHNWPISIVFNSILPTLNDAIIKQSTDNTINLGRTIKIQ